MSRTWQGKKVQAISATQLLELDPHILLNQYCRAVDAGGAMAPQYFYTYVVNLATSFLSFISGPPDFLGYGPPGFSDLSTAL